MFQSPQNDSWLILIIFYSPLGAISQLLLVQKESINMYIVHSLWVIFRMIIFWSTSSESATTTRKICVCWRSVCCVVLIFEMEWNESNRPGGAARTQQFNPEKWAFHRTQRTLSVKWKAEKSNSVKQLTRKYIKTTFHTTAGMEKFHREYTRAWNVLCGELKFNFQSSRRVEFSFSSSRSLYTLLSTQLPQKKLIALAYCELN